MTEGCVLPCVSAECVARGVSGWEPERQFHGRPLLICGVKAEKEGIVSFRSPSFGEPGEGGGEEPFPLYPLKRCHPSQDA